MGTFFAENLIVESIALRTFQNKIKKKQQI